MDAQRQQARWLIGQIDPEQCAEIIERAIRKYGERAVRAQVVVPTDPRDGSIDRGAGIAPARPAR